MAKFNPKDLYKDIYDSEEDDAGSWGSVSETIAKNIPEKIPEKTEYEEHVEAAEVLVTDDLEDEIYSMEDMGETHTERYRAFQDVYAKRTSVPTSIGWGAKPASTEPEWDADEEKLLKEAKSVSTTLYEETKKKLVEAREEEKTKKAAEALKKTIVPTIKAPAASASSAFATVDPSTLGAEGFAIYKFCENISDKISKSPAPSLALTDNKMTLVKTKDGIKRRVFVKDDELRPTGAYMNANKEILFKFEPKKAIAGVEEVHIKHKEALSALDGFDVYLNDLLGEDLFSSAKKAKEVAEEMVANEKARIEEEREKERLEKAKKFEGFGEW